MSNLIDNDDFLLIIEYFMIISSPFEHTYILLSNQGRYPGGNVCSKHVYFTTETDLLQFIPQC